MASSKLLIHAALLLLICAMELNSAEGCASFRKHCGAPFKHSGGELRAYCRTYNGGYLEAVIDLDHYLSNVNGNLVLGTGYSRTCQDFGYARLGRSELFVTANCKKFDGQLRSTSYNVESRLSSRNGVLKWNSVIC